MNPNNPSNEELIEEIDVDGNVPTVDDFIKELEEKEKSLEISSDLVIEVGDSDVEHENIHKSFIPDNSSDSINLQNSLSGQIPNIESQNPPANSEELKKLEKQISDLEKEKKELKDTLRRLQFDFDNYRKRTDRERSETFKNVLSSLATQMLPVLDNLNRALDTTADAESTENEKDFKQFLDGIVLVNQQLNEVLAGMGVKPIPAVGEPFDPNFHEAVAREETDEFPPETVTQELLRGYCIDERVIRPTMVRVSAKKNNDVPSAEETQEEPSDILN